MTQSPRPRNGLLGRVRVGLRGWLVLLVVVLLAVMALTSRSVMAGFAGTTSVGSNTISASTGFPTYPTAVGNNSPWAYYRGEESPSSAGTLAATDSSGSSHAGTYNGTTNGPATYWEFEENAGSTTADSSGAGNTGTLTSSPTWTTGKIGHALSFNGSTQYVAGARSAVDTSQSFTVSAWVYMTSIATYNTAVDQDGTTSGGFLLQYAQDVGHFAMSIGESDSTNPTLDRAYGTTSPSINTWYHIAGVYDRSAQQLKIYVNGSLEASAAHTNAHSWNATGNLIAGRGKWNGAATNFFPGKIDDVRVFQRALTAQEILSIGNGLPIVDWEFSEGAGTSVADRGSSGYAGQFVAGASWTTSGHDGNAASFDGTSGRATGVSGVAVATNTSYSVSAWVYLTAKTSNNATAVSENGTNISAFWLQYNHSSDRWVFANADADNVSANLKSATGTASPVLNTWYQLTGVYDSVGGNIKLYVNGSLQATTAVTTAFNATGVLAVGRALWSGGLADYWPGTIDTVKVWQRALSAAEITQELPLTDLEFSEGTGGTTADQGSNNTVGTITNATWNTTTGRDGDAMDFVSTNSARVTTSAALNTSNPYTVSAWARLSSNSGSNDRTVLCQNGGTACAFDVRYSKASDRWLFEASPSEGGTMVKAYSIAAPTLNTWYHLVGVYDGTNIMLYVNGVLQNTTATASVWNATTTLAIGRAGTGGSPIDFFDGTIDSVKTWQVALSAAQITDMYNGLPYVGGYTEADMTAGLTGALQGAQQGQQSTTAVAYAGLDNGYGNTSQTNPSAFTIECWFRVATTTTGGLLIGFGDTQTGYEANYDRNLYFDSGNKLTFGVNNGSAQTIRSSATYNDGAWHYVAASLGAAGMKLYVDGTSVATNAGVTTAQNYTGYWRWGGGRLTAWANRPTTDYLTGMIDEVAIYSSQLSDQQIAWHYHANH